MIYYICNKEGFIQNVEAYLDTTKVHYLPFEILNTFNVNRASHLVVTGTLDEIKLVFDFAQKNHISVGIIPKPEQKELIRTFYLPSSLEDAIALALTPSKKFLDLLYSNGTLVIQKVVIGDAPLISQYDTTFFTKLNIFWQNIKKTKKIKHTEIFISGVRNNIIRFFAIGIVGIEYNNNTFASKILSSKISSNDGKFAIVVLSPTSMKQYIAYLFWSLVSNVTTRMLPRTIGCMQTSKMHIASRDPLKVIVDSTIEQQTPVTLEVKQKALALSVGKEFWENQPNHPDSNKDSIRVDHLPSDRESTKLLLKGLPFFSRASQIQYSSLFGRLREESQFSENFIVLLILSSIIATFGLFINSSSVIIGAMLLAPLIQPIVGLSMGVLRQDEELELDGSKTILIGVLSVLLISALIASMVPIKQITYEMEARLSPTILDLFIAITSGVAAAYVKNNEKILGSLAGVAISVALVPPLSVSGIGLGWGEWDMFITSFLLFLTNFVGIVFASSLTFALLGFSPLIVAKKGIMIWMVIVILIGIPLSTAFSRMKEDSRIQKSLTNFSFMLGDHEVKLKNIAVVHQYKTTEIHSEVISSGILTAKEKRVLKKVVLGKIGKYAQVVVVFKYLL